MPSSSGATFDVVPLPANEALTDPVVLEEARATAVPADFQVRYWPAFDGIRGIGVLVVMAVHAGIPFTGGGLFAVDWFFVLSGFLITALLLEEWKSTGTIHLRAFYLRRALRLVPALVCVVAVTCIWVRVSKPAEAAAFMKAAMYAITYLTNIASMYGWVGVTPLSHTWSLGIEEQFYLLWPLLLISLLRYVKSERKRLVVVVVAAASSMLLRIAIALTTNLSIRSFVGIDTRADGLLLGCSVALLLSWRLVPDSQRLRTAVRTGSIAAVAFIVAMIPIASFGTAYVVAGIAFINFATAWLILSLFYAPVRAIEFVLSWGPFVWLGRRSYGIYLWHFPFIVLPLAIRLPPVAAAIVSVGVAALSFAFIERPFLKLKRRRTPLPAHDRLA